MVDRSFYPEMLKIIPWGERSILLFPTLMTRKTETFKTIQH